MNSPVKKDLSFDVEVSLDDSLESLESKKSVKEANGETKSEESMETRLRRLETLLNEQMDDSLYPNNGKIENEQKNNNCGESFNYNSTDLEQRMKNLDKLLENTIEQLTVNKTMEQAPKKNRSFFTKEVIDSPELNFSDTPSQNLKPSSELETPEKSNLSRNFDKILEQNESMKENESHASNAVNLESGSNKAKVKDDVSKVSNSSSRLCSSVSNQVIDEKNDRIDYWRGRVRMVEQRLQHSKNRMQLLRKENSKVLKDEKERGQKRKEEMSEEINDLKKLLRNQKKEMLISKDHISRLNSKLKRKLARDASKSDRMQKSLNNQSFQAEEAKEILHHFQDQNKIKDARIKNLEQKIEQMKAGTLLDVEETFFGKEGKLEPMSRCELTRKIKDLYHLLKACEVSKTKGSTSATQMNGLFRLKKENAILKKKLKCLIELVEESEYQKSKVYFKSRNHEENIKVYNELKHELKDVKSFKKISLKNEQNNSPQVSSQLANMCSMLQINDVELLPQQIQKVLNFVKLMPKLFGFIKDVRNLVISRVKPQGEFFNLKKLLSLIQNKFDQEKRMTEIRNFRIKLATLLFVADENESSHLQVDDNLVIEKIKDLLIIKKNYDVLLAHDVLPNTLLSTKDSNQRIIRSMMTIFDLQNLGEDSMIEKLNQINKQNVAMKYVLQQLKALLGLSSNSTSTEVIEKVSAQLKSC